MKKAPLPQPPTERGSVVALRDRIGPIGRVVSGIAISGTASRAFRSVERESIEADAKIAKTAIAIAQTKACATLVARAMPIIGGLTVHLNSATAAVDAELTSGCVADLVGHLANRSDGLETLKDLQAKGVLDHAEAEDLVQQVEEALADNIDRVRARMALSKDAVDHLYGYGLSGIRHAEGDIGRLS